MGVAVQTLPLLLLELFRCHSESIVMLDCLSDSVPYLALAVI